MVASGSSLGVLWGSKKTYLVEELRPLAQADLRRPIRTWFKGVSRCAESRPVSLRVRRAGRLLTVGLLTTAREGTRGTAGTRKPAASWRRSAKTARRTILGLGSVCSGLGRSKERVAISTHMVSSGDAARERGHGPFCPPESSHGGRSLWIRPPKASRTRVAVGRLSIDEDKRLGGSDGAIQAPLSALIEVEEASAKMHRS
jgi:hypothetical protein